MIETRVSSDRNWPRWAQVGQHQDLRVLSESVGALEPLEPDLEIHRFLEGPVYARAVQRTMTKVRRNSLGRPMNP